MFFQHYGQRFFVCFPCKCSHFYVAQEEQKCTLFLRRRSSWLLSSLKRDRNLLSWCSSFSTNLNSLGASRDSKVQCSTLPFFFMQFIKAFTTTFIRFQAHIHDSTVYFVRLLPSRQQFDKVRLITCSHSSRCHP